MKQFFAHYKLWECYQNGMYKIVPYDQNEINKSINVLRSCDYFEEAMNNILAKWVVSHKVHLTDLSINRRAYLGRAGCCISKGVPEILTRYAWNCLTEKEQNRANELANKVIKNFESNYILNGQGILRF